MIERESDDIGVRRRLEKSQGNEKGSQLLAAQSRPKGMTEERTTA